MVGSSYPANWRTLARLLSSVPLALGAIAPSALSAAGCHATVNADVNARVRHDAEQGPDERTDLDKSLSAKALTAPAPALTPGEAPLLGARRDMTLVSEHANAACACVKVAIGSAQSAAFHWEGAAPHLNDDTQLAIALSSEGVPCTGEPKGSSGASYWGYRISGNDVIVFVEGARAGRPLAVAAIIPKPVADGQVYFAPAKPKLPYGRSLDGKSGRCKIGNVPIKRVTPFTAGELGDISLGERNSGATIDAGE